MIARRNTNVFCAVTFTRYAFVVKHLFGAKICCHAPPGDESEILEPFETTSDTCFLAVYVSELSGICNDVIEGHEY